MNQTKRQPESTAIMQVIANESIAFWDKDFDAWAACWSHTPNVRIMGWWARGGVTVIEGSDAVSERMQKTMAENPEPNPTTANVRRENVNLSVVGEMAWLTFDQYAADTGDLEMDMPGLVICPKSSAIMPDCIGGVLARNRFSDGPYVERRGSWRELMVRGRSSTSTGCWRVGNRMFALEKCEHPLSS